MLQRFRTRVLSAVLALVGAAASRPCLAESSTRNAMQALTADAASIRALVEAGRPAEAEAEARTLLVRVERESGASSLETATVLDALVKAFTDGDKAHDPDARRFAERSLAIKEAILGPVHPEVATSLNNLALLLQRAGEHAAARPLYERSLAIDEESFGPGHPKVASSLGNLAGLLQAMGDHAAAKPLYERALAAHEKALGPDHRSVALSLGNLAGLLAAMGDHGRARALYERSLATWEKALGPEHLDVATSLNNLGVLLQEMGDPSGARPLHERSLAIKQKAFGPDHPAVAESLDNLAGVLSALGDHAAARLLHERSLAIFERAWGPEHPAVAMSLTNLGVLLAESGDHGSARPLLERALAVREKVFGADHPLVAESLNNLAGLLYEIGDHQVARATFEQSLEVAEAALGADHPAVAGSLSNLAVVLKSMGDHVGALAYLERSMAIREKALGPEHPDVALGAGNMGVLLQSMGDPVRARAYHERALAIWEKVFGPDHPFVARSLTGLADIMIAEGNGAGAQPLLERALVIREAALGPDHPDVATSLHDLAGLRRSRGDHVGARPLYERSLTIWEKAWGRDHPLVARSLTGLALTMQAQGELDAAGPLFERALSISEQALGRAHPDVSRCLTYLAGHHRAGGDNARALSLALRAEEVSRDHARLTFSALSERQAIGLASTRSPALDLALSLASPALAPDERASLLDAIVRSRALVLDEIAARHRTASGASPSAPAARARAAASQRLANLLVRGPGRQHPDVHRQLVDAAVREKEQAERALASQSTSFRDEQERLRVGLAEVTQALSPGEALLAYYRFGRVDLGHSDAALRAASESSYVAFVLRGGEKHPAIIHLGHAANVDSLVSAWADEAADPLTATRAAGDALRRAIWEPVAPRLEGMDRVVIVPDGALHLVSFAALPVGDDQYLVETGPALHHVSAERDLVVPVSTRARSEGLLAVGGPAFDDTVAFRALAPAKPTLVETVLGAAASLLPFRGKTSRCATFTSLRFGPLPAAGSEAGEVVAMWRARAGVGAAAGDALHLDGPRASETAFKTAAPGRRTLHLATHGFFLGGACEEATAATRGLDLGTGTAAALLPVMAENPLLLSGLAFAGANNRAASAPGEDDGILTAEEIATLDLAGVEWAVLSACDTARGDVRPSEGVFGLRRAFQLAGAGTVIMSLWTVDDESTRQWMTALYRARLEGSLATPDCVRQASLDVLRARRQAGLGTAPFHWGAFVAAGDRR